MFLRLILAFTLVSCLKQESQKEDFYGQSKLMWYEAHSLKISSYYVEEEPIKEPRGAWSKIFELETNTSKFCLYFKPSKNINEVRVLKNDCSLTQIDNYVLKLSPIYNFAFRKTQWGITLLIDQNEYRYQFINMNKPKNYKIFDSSHANQLLAGMIIGELKTKKLTDNYFCYKVNNECETIQENICDLCLSSFYPVVSSNCRRKRSFMCGENKCGQINEPACIRGFKAVELELDYCMNDSPVAYCRDGLRVMCVNNLLICR